MSAAQDEVSQNKGLTAIIYNVGEGWLNNFDSLLLQGIAQVTQALPIRDAAVHYCYTDPKFGALVAFFSKFAEADVRTRSRLHQGTHVEAQYELLGYGIPTNMLPLDGDGAVRRKEHWNFLKMRMAQEERIRNGDKDMKLIIVPCGKDVLFGRGKPKQTHLGNLRLAYLVEEQLRAYFEGGRKDKVRIANSIYQTMTMDSVRFLRQDDEGVYVEVDERTALDKIEHFFRNRKHSLPKFSPTTALKTNAETEATSTSKKRRNDNLTSFKRRATPSPVPELT
jgi:hypothetical protein